MMTSTCVSSPKSHLASIYSRLDFEAPDGEFQAGKFFVIGRFKIKPGQLSEIKRRQLTIQPVGVRKSIGDGNAHVGYPQLRHDGRVDEFDHGVDDALPVNDDFDFSLQSEKPFGFDIFQPLVHHGCGIDGDFVAHRPVRMIERLLDGHVLHLFAGEGAERAAGRGQDDLFDLILFFTVHRLQDGAMLAVDGDDGYIFIFRGS